MLSLVKKDMFTMSQTLKKQMFLALILGLGTSFYVKSGIYILGMLIMIVSMSLVSSFSVDEYSKFNAYALSLPVSRKDLVSCKYFLYIAINLVTSLAGFILGAIVDIFYAQLDIVVLGVGALACSGIFLIITSFSMPLYFKYGVEKGRILNVLIYILPFLLISFFGDSITAPAQISALEQENLLIFVGIALVVLMVVAFVLSYIISIKIVSKKEY